MNIKELFITAVKNLQSFQAPSKQQRARDNFSRKLWQIERSPKPGTIIRCSDRDYVINKHGSWERVEGSVGRGL